MIVRIVSPNQLQRFIPEITRLFEDFLRRSKEPFTIEWQWAAIVRALAESDRTLFLMAFDQRIRPVGFLIAQTGFDFYGISYAHVPQIYVKPKHPQIADDLKGTLIEWAQAKGCQAVSSITRRNSFAFSRRFGTTPYGVSHVILLDQEASHEGRPADPTTVDADDSAGVPALRQEPH